MKATEFIEKYGWFGAKEYLAGTTFLNGNLFVFTNVEELQNLVNAYELVEFYGGVTCAKTVEYGNIIPNYIVDELKKSVKLVESVNGFPPSVNPNQNIPEPPPPPPIRLIKVDKLIK